MKRRWTGSLLVLATLASLWFVAGLDDDDVIEPKLVPPRLEVGDALGVAEVEPPPAQDALIDEDALITSVSGRVVFFDTDEPVYGALVRAWLEGDVTLETISDEVGNYSLRGLASEADFSITAEFAEEGWVEAERVPVLLEPGETLTGVDLVLMKGGSISGKVTETHVVYHRSAVAGILQAERRQYSSIKEREEASWRALGAVASEQAEPVDGVRVFLEGITTRESASETDGSYSFTGLRPETYRVWIEAPPELVRNGRKRADQLQKVSISSGEEKFDVDFNLQLDSVSVVGRVLDRGGIPIEGAELTIDHAPTWSGESGSRVTGSWQTMTDSDGYYELTGLRPIGFIRISRFLWRGDLPDYGMFALDTRAEGYAGRRILIPSFDEADIEFARFFIDATLPMWEGSSDGGGPTKFREEYMPRVEGNVIHLDIVLEGESIVSGRLVDSLGKVIANTEIRMKPVNPRRETSKPMVPEYLDPVSNKTDRLGNFLVVGVPEGIYIFDANTRAQGWQRTRNAALSVGPAEAIEGIELVVESAEERGALTGWIRDESTGGALTDYRIEMRSVDSPTESHPVWGTVTIDKESGVFRMEDISPGSAVLLVVAEGYPPTELEAEVVGGETSDVTFVLGREAWIEVSVTLDGVPAEARVSARRMDGQQIATEQYYLENARPAESDETGLYTIRKLPEGDYTVEAAAVTGKNSATTFFRYETEIARVKTGRITQIEIDVTGGAGIHGTYDFPGRYRRGRVHLLEGHVPE
ncbi:MAG TPA: carboxypeptidase regulatory-like domain-containing protein, partial [Candidatus Hydrogenedentes bacterium]|nr:carboxypeptidase regulatory-like domain-containing protein [Candidatus Hydrogenedentota bacterium]